jgi:hypothetical protein
VFINPSKNKKTDVIHDDAKNRRKKLYYRAKTMSLEGIL